VVSASTAGRTTSPFESPRGTERSPAGRTR
jgi:hypothetical protein